MAYRDPNPPTPTQPEYNKNDVDPRVLNYTEQTREKKYGEHTREVMARAAEIISIVANEAKVSSEEAIAITQSLLDGSFDDAELAANFEEKFRQKEQEYAPELTSIKTEVDIARGTSNSLAERLNSTDAQLADTVHMSQYKSQETETDDTARIKRAVESINGNGTIALEKDKTYYISEEVVGESLTIIGNNAKIIVSQAGGAFRMKGQYLFSRIATVDYKKGDMKVVIDSTIDVTPGQLLHIQSPENYNTSRDYYKKGGNVLVTRVDGSNVYLSMALPFDMAALDLKLDFYNPCTATADNLSIEHSGTLPEGLNGILVQHGAYGKMKNVKTRNFVKGIRLERCINYELDGITPKETYYVGTDTSYGIHNYSCTNLSILNSDLSSGRHGYCSSGQEPTFGTYFRNCSLSSETMQDGGLDTHHNNFDTLLETCQVQNLNICGNVTLKKCTISVGENLNHNLHVMDNKEHANYIFEDCNFLGNSQLRLVAYNQQLSPKNRFFGSLVLNNCQGVNSIRMRIADTRTDGIIAETRSLVVENTDVKSIYIDDNIDNIVLDLVKGTELTLGTATDIVKIIKKVRIVNSTDILVKVNHNVDSLILDDVDCKVGKKLIQQETSRGLIKRICLSKVGLPDAYRLLELRSFNEVVFRDTFHNSLSDPNGSLYFNGNGKVYFDNTDLSGIGRGIEIEALPSELRAEFSKLKFYGTPWWSIPIIRGNSFEEFGSITARTDSGGILGIAHTLGKVPSFAQVTLEGNNNHNVKVTNKLTSRIDVTVRDSNNITVKDTEFTLSWMARL